MYWVPLPHAKRLIYLYLHHCPWKAGIIPLPQMRVLWLKESNNPVLCWSPSRRAFHCSRTHVGSPEPGLSSPFPAWLFLPERQEQLTNTCLDHHT